MQARQGLRPSQVTPELTIMLSNGGKLAQLSCERDLRLRRGRFHDRELPFLDPAPIYHHGDRALQAVLLPKHREEVHILGNSAGLKSKPASF